MIPAPRGGWSVKKEGVHRAARHFETKKSAVRWARELSRERGTQLYIHSSTGGIVDKHSYGPDPVPSRDW